VKRPGPSLEAAMLVCAVLLSVCNSISAQNAGSALLGTVTNGSGATVADATVSVKNSATGQTAQANTDSMGQYRVPNLPAGDYQVAVSAPDYSTNTFNVTIAPGADKKLDVRLAGVLSLQDLGISQEQAQGSAEQQARLNKRSHMLMLHQRFGLIAAVPLIATVATSFGAGGRSTSNTVRDVHAGLGAATAGLYFTSAYFALRAPGIKGTQRRGPIRVHRALAWIHGPGMILTPILGALAFEQKSKGERIHGIASAHGAVAIVTAAAYGAAIISVSFKF
jgi:hypothetical protein